MVCGSYLPVKPNAGLSLRGRRRRAACCPAIASTTATALASATATTATALSALGPISFRWTPVSIATIALPRRSRWPARPPLWRLARTILSHSPLLGRFFCRAFLELLTRLRTFVAGPFDMGCFKRAFDGRRTFLADHRRSHADSRRNGSLGFCSHCIAQQLGRSLFFAFIRAALFRPRDHRRLDVAFGNLLVGNQDQSVVLQQ